jgi:uncharacterized protein (DUF885 family)
MSVRTTLKALGAITLIVLGYTIYAYGWGKPYDFHHLIERQTILSIRHSPETLSDVGAIDNTLLDFHSGKLDDISLEARKRRAGQTRRFLREVESWDRDRLTGQRRLSHEFVSWNYGIQLEFTEIDWLPGAYLPYAVDQLFSVPILLPQFLDNQHSIVGDKSAQRYISRLHAVGLKFDQLIEFVDFQESKGVVPPRFAITRLMGQLTDFIAPAPSENMLYLSLNRRLAELEDVPDQRREALLAEAEGAITNTVYPAYARLIARLEALLTEAQGNHGAWSLPDGERYYNLALRFHTTTDLTADEIHQIGLAEVARIQDQMDAILRAEGYTEGTVAERMAALGEEERFQFADTEEGREELIAYIKEMLDSLDPLIPAYFHRVPEQPVEVQRVPAYAESSAPAGYYYPPAMDGSRPGIYFINLGNMKEHTRWSLPTLTYHEANPGHHFQLALAQSIGDIPMLRRARSMTAFAEGWALYAEQLVYEMGVYDDDPYGNLGRLQAELYRAVRLVVDTGIHRKRWTREQAIEYMVDNTGLQEEAVRVEIERYFVMPGQACAYKIGLLKILELRERARQALGDAFDIRDFHSVALESGALPLSVLERVVDEWIDAMRAS